MEFRPDWTPCYPRINPATGKPDNMCPSDAFSQDNMSKMKKAYASGDQQIELVRNDSYFGGLAGHTAYIDEVDFKISFAPVEDLEARLGAG